MRVRFHLMPSTEHSAALPQASDLARTSSPQHAALSVPVLGYGGIVHYTSQSQPSFVPSPHTTTTTTTITNTTQSPGPHPWRGASAGQARTEPSGSRRTLSAGASPLSPASVRPPWRGAPHNLARVEPHAFAARIQPQHGAAVGALPTSASATAGDASPVFLAPPLLPMPPIVSAVQDAVQAAAAAAAPTPSAAGSVPPSAPAPCAAPEPAPLVPPLAPMPPPARNIAQAPAQAGAPVAVACPAPAPGFAPSQAAQAVCSNSALPCVLPSFAMGPLFEQDSILPAISSPLMQLSHSAQARVVGPKAFAVHESIFACATQQSFALFEHRLKQDPHAVAVWHPEGYNLLHHVVRHQSLTHVCLVLAAIKGLSSPKRTSLLDGVGQDGLDAVRLAIDCKATFILSKLLEAGCDPTRARYRDKPLWFARLAHPLAPYSRIEDAALYAVRRRNTDAVDLLLLWDEQRVLHLPESRFAFDLEELMAIAMSFDDLRVRDAMVDVLHAARRRRPVAYLSDIETSGARSVQAHD